ncbi:agropine synthesis reductase [Bosea sp. ANAM02]|nr:agropine synthesis reductase [Bosea sp. ANAM02]
MAKVAMVSGASRGIGRAIAAELGRQGFALSLGIRDAKASPGEGFAPAGLASFAYEAGEPGNEAAWVAETMARFGRIDVLVNAAGILREVSLESGDPADLDDLLAINVKAPFRLIQAALPHLNASGEGRVVNVASLSGKRVRNGNAGYQMSKFAMMGLSHAVRQAAFASGVRALALCPSYVATDMTANSTISPEQMTQPQDVANLVAMIVRLPNTASISELVINCGYEAMY